VLAVEHRGSGDLLGHVGFSPLDEEVETSFAIAEATRGRGYAVEAVRPACEWIAGAFALPGILAITAAGNVASRRTLERTGFAHLGDASMRFQGDEQPVSRYRWRPSASL
jgi:RimJ/RimL family protein N-acetyltransferase